MTRPWERWLTRVAAEVETPFDQLKERLARRFDPHDPLLVTPFAGFGNRERIWQLGRVLEEPGTVPSDDGDSAWWNLLQTFRRFETDEVPGAKVEAKVSLGEGDDQEHRAELVTGPEGYFEADLPTPAATAESEIWRTVHYRLLEPLELDPSNPGAEPVTATGRVLVPTDRARFLVVSDIDDTVLVTKATQLIPLVRMVLFGSARTRLPLPGVAAFYRALVRDPGETLPVHPLVYLSSSPWNLYDLLEEAFEILGLPPGPLLLRDWGLDETGAGLPTHHGSHKLGALERLMATWDLPVLLLGDSGQEDPEIYLQALKDFPGRVQAIYIRDADPARSARVQELAEEAGDHGVDMLLVQDTLTAARHAADHGWIEAEDLPVIEAEQEMRSE